MKTFIVKKITGVVSASILVAGLLLFLPNTTLAEVETTYANDLGSGTAFQYRTDYTGNSSLLNESLSYTYNSEGDLNEYEAMAWKYYTMPDTVINSSSIAFLKLKAVDPALNFSYVVDSQGGNFNVCGSENTFEYYFYELPDVFPNDNELGDSVYNFSLNDYVFKLTPSPRRALSSTSPTDENSLSELGTCPYSIDSKGENIPAGNYFAVAFHFVDNGYLVDWVAPYASFPGMTEDNYASHPYTLAGYGLYPLTSGFPMALGSNVQDTDIVGCTDGVCDYYKDFSQFSGFVQPDFYITTDISAPPVSGSGVCNPFSDSISTAFLNTSFSFGGCLSYLFIPSDWGSSSISSVKNSLMTKFPFNYITYASSIWSSLESGTGSVGSLSVNIGSHSLTLFSPNMLSSNPVAPLIRSFLNIAFYIFLIFAVYKRVVSLFDNKTLF